jgi:hypothetical protein
MDERGAFALWRTTATIEHGYAGLYHADGRHITGRISLDAITAQWQWFQEAEIAGIASWQGNPRPSPDLGDHNVWAFSGAAVHGDCITYGL